MGHENQFIDGKVWPPVMRITHPRSSESDKDIFALVKDDFVKVGNIEFSVSGRRRRLDVGLDARLLGNAMYSAIISVLFFAWVEGYY